MDTQVRLVGLSTACECEPTHSKLKRLIDIGLGGFALVLLLPVFAILAAVVLVDSGWPPLYSQMRVGLMGQQFRLWKFRTMVRDAEEMQPTLSAVNEAPFPTFKMRDDPRVTRTGRFLRRSSLDELPQLWNVLLGQMSLVGPRPPLASEVAHYDQRALGRLCVRPGLTCVWQVDGRDGSATSFEKWLAMDLQYIEHWSIGSDFVIIAKTFAAIGKMTGQ